VFLNAGSNCPPSPNARLAGLPLSCRSTSFSADRQHLNVFPFPPLPTQRFFELTYPDDGPSEQLPFSAIVLGDSFFFLLWAYHSPLGSSLRLFRGGRGRLMPYFPIDAMATSKPHVDPFFGSRLDGGLSGLVVFVLLVARSAALPATTNYA